jgi:hypothetical protein
MVLLKEISEGIWGKRKKDKNRVIDDVAPIQ